MAAGRLDRNRRSWEGQEVIPLDLNEGCSGGGFAGLPEVELSCNHRMGWGGDLCCSQWFGLEQSWKRPFLETVCSACPLYLSPLDIQSIFLKEMALQFPMNWEICVCVGSSLTTQKPLEICFLWLESRAKAIASVAKWVGKSSELAVLLSAEVTLNIRCWGLLAGCSGKCREAPGTGHRGFAAAAGNEAGKGKNSTQLV